MDSHVGGFEASVDQVTILFSIMKNVFLFNEILKNHVKKNKFFLNISRTLNDLSVFVS